MENTVIPELDLARVRRWVNDRNGNLPGHVRQLVRYELALTDRTVTILECRPPWKPEYGPEWTRHPIARLRYTKKRKEWSLYWRDRNLKFQKYGFVAPSPCRRADRA